MASPSAGGSLSRPSAPTKARSTDRPSSDTGSFAATGARGLASEGARELVRHGFEDLGLTRIFAETMTVNAVSRATMPAVRLQHVRTFHTHWDEPISGSELGEVEYAISREQWLAR